MRVAVLEQPLFPLGSRDFANQEGRVSKSSAPHRAAARFCRWGPILQQACNLLAACVHQRGCDSSTARGASLLLLGIGIWDDDKGLQAMANVVDAKHLVDAKACWQQGGF